MNTDHVVVQGSDLWCKACGQREPLALPLPVKDLSHLAAQDVTRRRYAAGAISTTTGSKGVFTPDFALVDRGRHGPDVRVQTDAAECGADLTEEHKTYWCSPECEARAY